MDLRNQNNHANDGMCYPAIDQLVTKTTSKYRLVMAAALRAKQLRYDENEKPIVENPHSKKEIGIALEEIHEDTVTISESHWGGSYFYVAEMSKDGSDYLSGRRFLGYIYIDEEL